MSAMLGGVRLNGQKQADVLKKKWQRASGRGQIPVLTLPIYYWPLSQG